MTDEHVWPEMLGGRLGGQGFLIRTCAGCNSTCGLFVDALFGKSWIVTARMGMDAMRYVDLDGGGPLPLTYMGIVQALDPSPYRTAELWISPCRSRILHLHDNLDDKFSGYAGGNPLRRKRRPGVAIFLNAADDERWVRIGLRSFAAKFTREQRMVWGIEHRGDASYVATFERKFGPKPNAEHKAIADRYMAVDRPNEPTRFALTMRTDFDRRFMAKVALGLGYKFIGPAFLESAWARLLRETLWAKTGTVQDRLRPIGWGELGDTVDELDAFLSWPGGISIAIMAAGPMLALHFNLFGLPYKVIISDDPRVWAGAHDFREGIAWVLIPQRDFCEGPMHLATFIAHKQGYEASARLKEAEGWRVDVATLRQQGDGEDRA